MISIFCEYACPSVTRENFVKVVASVHNQIQKDFSPHWQKFANVLPQFDPQTKASEDSWKIVVSDQPLLGEADSLGFHIVTQKPQGKVFAQFAEINGTPWSVILSHEVIEMLGDEYLNLHVLRTENGKHQFWYRELCDPVQHSMYLDEHGVELSNFVLPNFYRENSTGPYDFLNVLSKPFEVFDGGYAGYLEVEQGVLQRKQILGTSYPSWRKQIATRKIIRQR